MRTPALTLLISLLLPAAASAQSPEPEVGDRLRVESWSGAEWEGVLESSSPVGLTLQTGEDTHFVPNSEIARLERSLGKQKNFGKNFALSLALSAGVFGLSFAAGYSDDCDLLCPSSRGEAAGWGLMFGGIVGIPLGVIVGLTRTEEVWETLSNPGHRTGGISVRPQLGDGVGLAVSLPFGN